MLKSRSPARACRNENGWREPRCTLAPARYRSNGNCCSTAPPAGARSLAPPALQDANASTVRQTETADVQRVRRGVFTAPRLLTMVNIAAGKAAEMIDLTQIARHQLPGQRLRLLLDVQRIRSAPAGSWRENYCSAAPSQNSPPAPRYAEGSFPRCRPPAGWR